MKSFNISLDDLDTLFGKLWEVCKGKGFFKAIPEKSCIEVHESNEAQSRIIAIINILDLDDPYLVRDNLFKDE